MTVWGRAPTDRADKLVHLERERLRPIDFRRQNVARAIRELVLPESLRVAVDDPVVEDADRLVPALLVDDHLLAPDDHGAAQLARCQPAHLEIGHGATPEAQREEGNVGDPRHDRVSSGSGDRPGRLAQPVPQDREVVRAEVPHDADIGLVKAEVHPARGDEVDLSQLPAIEQLLDRPDRGAVQERVAAHQRPATFTG